MTTAFLITSLVIIATPGTGAVFTVAAALARGLRAGLVAALASAVCLVPHVLAVMTGLASLLHASAVAFSLLKYVGVAYLLYLAVMTWRGAGTLALTPATEPKDHVSTWSVFRDAMLLNLFNPKLTIFFVAFLPQFVDPTREGAIAQMLMLCAWFATLTFGVYIVYAAAAVGLRSRILTKPSVMRRLEQGFALTFAALAARLATALR